jgi:hypothetical protein
MTAADLCAVADCRVVQFMFHDRVAWGGSLIAVALLYFWLAAFPLREGARWAWAALASSGALGFGSFLAYLGYGYLDTWHGAATLALLPLFLAGLWRSRRMATRTERPWLRTQEGLSAPWLLRWGRYGIIATGGGMALAGGVILFLGTTDVFVAEDLAFMGVTRADLDAINPRLVPLIAHDRAGFGGGLATAGLLVGWSAWFARPHRAFHQAIGLAGAIGFGGAIGTHFVEGYLNVMHLAPAFAGAGLFVVSIAAELAGGRSIRRTVRSRDEMLT